MQLNRPKRIVGHHGDEDFHGFEVSKIEKEKLHRLPFMVVANLIVERLGQTRTMKQKMRLPISDLSVA